jgi:hypothetical protein
LLVLNLIFSGVAYAAPESQEQILTDGEIALLEDIDYDFVFSHVKRISDEIGVGVAGNPAEKRRADYLAGVLEDIGYEPWSYATSPDGVDDYFQTIENDSSVANIIGGSVTINGHEYPANAPTWNGASVYRGDARPEVSGEVVYFPTVDAAVAAEEGDVAGKIVLTHRKTSAFAAEARALEAKGALAVVYFYNKHTIAATGKTSAESRFAAPTTGAAINIPVVLTSYFDGELILSGIRDGDPAEGAITATVVNRRNLITQNVVAIKKAVEPTDRFVLIGGHYDSVFGAIGANDNLSGPSSILGIAKALKDVPTEYNVVFAFWGAEESGLRGSRYFYANTLQPGDYYKNGIAYFNLDMAATSQKSNSKITIHTPFRVSATDNTPVKSAAGELFEREAARYWAYSDGKWGDWWEEGVKTEYYGNCSDHASISGANAGVAANVGISQVYAYWGGPGTTEYNYHVVGDRYDWPGEPFKLQGEDSYYAGNYSRERAEILASVFALSLYESAGALSEEGYADRVTVSPRAVVDGDGHAAYGEVSVTGKGFTPGERVALVAGYNVEPALQPIPDYADQVSADADGNFSLVITTGAKIIGGGAYWVRASAASLGGARLYRGDIAASYANITAPVRYSGKLKTTEVIPVYANSSVFEVSSSNTNVVAVAPVTGEAGELVGVRAEYKRAGTAYISISTPSADGRLVKSIQVTVK